MNAEPFVSAGRGAADLGAKVLFGAAMGAVFVFARAWGSLAAAADEIDRRFDLSGRAGPVYRARWRRKTRLV